MKIEIKNRWTASVIFSHDVADNTIALTVKAAHESGADLSGAYLSGADLSGADLLPIRDDIWAVLSSAPAEVPGLIAALKDGRIDGSTYSGKCACLVGTLANVRHTDEFGIESLRPNSSRPAERFFMGINKGDKPETNQFSALALQWCEEWYGRVQAAFVPIASDTAIRSIGSGGQT